MKNRQNEQGLYLAHELTIIFNLIYNTIHFILKKYQKLANY